MGSCWLASRRSRSVRVIHIAITAGADSRTAHVGPNVFPSMSVHVFFLTCLVWVAQADISFVPSPLPPDITHSLAWTHGLGSHDTYCIHDILTSRISRTHFRIPCTYTRRFLWSPGVTVAGDSCTISRNAPLTLLAFFSLLIAFFFIASDVIIQNYLRFAGRYEVGSHSPY